MTMDAAVRQFMIDDLGRAKDTEGNYVNPHYVDALDRSDQGREVAIEEILRDGGLKGTYLKNQMLKRLVTAMNRRFKGINTTVVPAAAPVAATAPAALVMIEPNVGDKRR